MAMLNQKHIKYKVMNLTKKSGIFFIFLLLLAAVFTSCKKNESTITPTTPVKSGKEEVANIALPATGLIAYWSCDNTGNDLSGNSNDASVNNVSSVADRFGNLTGAYHFDGKTSYMTVPASTALELSNASFTLNAWIKLDSYNATNGSIIFSKRTNTGTGWSWGVLGGGVSSPQVAGQNSFGPGGKNPDGSSPNVYGSKVVSTNQWHMLTCTYKYANGEFSIYVDGALDVTKTGVLSPVVTGSTLYIGSDNITFGTNYGFKGSLDDLSIYNSAISASTVSKLYVATSPNPNPGLIAYWPFNNSGTDRSGNFNNGVVTDVSSTADRFGNALGAYHFDGSTSFVALPDNPPLRLSNTDFTLNSWIKLDSYNSSLASIIMSKYDKGGSGWLWAISGSGESPYVGFLDFNSGYFATSANSTKSISVGQWHMVTSVYTLASKQLAIYIDGALNNTVSNISSPDAAATGQLIIGNANNGYFFQGALDEVSIYNSALSVSTITQMYKATH